MKLILAAMMAMTGMMGAGTKNAVNHEHPVLTICMNPGSGNAAAFYLAKATVSRILVDTHVKISWERSDGPCLSPGAGIRVKVNASTSLSEHPGALAYASPFTRTEIVLFLDRIRDVVPNKDKMGMVLGHVLAHEIVHLLQGMARHSSSGLMKPHWNPVDFSDMQWNLIMPAEEDIDLIQLSLLNWTWNAKEVR